MGVLVNIMSLKVKNLLEEAQNSHQDFALGRGRGSGSRLRN